MDTWMWIAIGACALFGFVAVNKVRPMSLDRGLEIARKEGDFSPLIEVIERGNLEQQATLWNQVFDRLWKAYDREIVAQLVVEAAMRCDADILQYWIQKVLEIEPEIAQDVFSPAFLIGFFKPDVAAKQGKCGCGGGSCK